jgi:hypothetical protein
MLDHLMGHNAGPSHETKYWAAKAPAATVLCTTLPQAVTIALAQQLHLQWQSCTAAAMLAPLNRIVIGVCKG